MGKKKAKVVIPDGDDMKGKEIFMSQCAICHSSVAGDDKNAAAPALNGIVGRKIASSTSFAYSGAFKKQKFNWTPEHLFGYIKGPGKYIPGNKMGFAGIQDPQDLGDLISYLKTI